MLRTKRTVLFDMDGVLVDTRESIEFAWRSAAARFGRDLTVEDFHEHVHGQPGSRTIQNLFSELSPGDQLLLKAIVDETEEESLAPLTSGVLEIMERLKGNGHKIGLVTSSWRSRVSHVLKANNLEGMFNTVVTREDVANGKPSPEPYLRAMSRLNAKRPTAIEDSAAGVRSAASAGCHTIGLQWLGSADLMASGADAVARDFVDVEQLIAVDQLLQNDGILFR